MACLSREQLGRGKDLAKAAEDYRHVLTIDPTCSAARRGLALVLVELGRREESFPIWYEEAKADKQVISWLAELTTDAMKSRDLFLAGELANVYARLCGGTSFGRANGPEHPQSCVPADCFLTRSKLEHDIEQFRYLVGLGILRTELEELIPMYRSVMEVLPKEPRDLRVSFSQETIKVIGHVYSRLIHVRDTPRVKKALSDNWDAREVEKQYLSSRCGLVVVDDFLCATALDEIRRFCLESTVWSGNRYSHGRLGAFFYDGFNCPLLLQVAEELRERLPTVIGERYPLRQLWGFKNGHTVPPHASIHADFAAVNVNFWITPTDANLDANNGGLDVYEVEAPWEWDFETYNGRADMIQDF